MKEYFPVIINRYLVETRKCPMFYNKDNNNDNRIWSSGQIVYTYRIYPLKEDI